MNEGLASVIRNARFTAVRMREGYDMAEVDWFLDQLESKVVAGEAVETFVAEAHFTPVRRRQGYDTGEVDRFLRKVVQTARGQAPGVAGTPGLAKAGPKTAAAAPVAPGTPPADVPAPVEVGPSEELPSVIDEVHSPVSRFLGRLLGRRKD